MIRLHNIRKALRASLPLGAIAAARHIENKLAAPPRFVIVGTGRCGTTYTAELLTQSGVPCGHESIFSYTGMNYCFGYEGDASWLALPHLGGYQGIVVHQTRHPLAVINSLM